MAAQWPRGCGKKLNPKKASIRTISLCVASLTKGRVYATSPCGARTTIEEIILNLNVLREEERTRTVLASFRKRADLLRSKVYVNALFESQQLNQIVLATINCQQLMTYL